VGEDIIYFLLLLVHLKEIPMQEKIESNNNEVRARFV
jgi:hypothetical protein